VREGLNLKPSNRKQKEPKMKRIIAIAIGFLGVLMGVGLILPALAKVRDLGAMPSNVIVPYTLGIGLALLGIATTAFSLTGRKAT
jgi:hypothetical protein